MVKTISSFAPGARPFDLASHPRPDWLKATDPLKKQMFVTEAGRQTVGIIDTEKDELEFGEIPVGPEPKAIAFSDSACMMVVFDSKDHNLIKIDPNRHEKYGEPISVRPNVEVREVRVDPDQHVVVVLPDGTRHYLNDPPQVLTCPPSYP
jgi:DNA-binding beta-propeller fold protein YncE